MNIPNHIVIKIVLVASILGFIMGAGAGFIKVWYL